MIATIRLLFIDNFSLNFVFLIRMWMFGEDRVHWDIFIPTIHALSCSIQLSFLSILLNLGFSPIVCIGCVHVGLNQDDRSTVLSGLNFSFRKWNHTFFLNSMKFTLLKYNIHICPCPIPLCGWYKLWIYSQVHVLVHTHAPLSDKDMERSAIYKFIMVFCCIWKQL